jgi:predicted nucleic acid-binding Zn ribbon protein
MVRAAERGRRKSGKGKSPKELRVALQELTESLGIRKTLRQYDVITSWEVIVGEAVARVATPVRLENGVLFVHVASAPWRAELSMRRIEILGKIQEHTGPRVVREIRFR